MNRLALRDFTAARVEIARTGHSLRTTDLLTLRIAHAQARDAVHTPFNTDEILSKLQPEFRDCVLVRTMATNRTTYLHRPDLGRCLDEGSRISLKNRHGVYDVVFVLADGLSALAVQNHAAPTLEALSTALRGWTMAPLVVVEQARVAIGDQIAECLGAKQSVVLIGERPGMSSPDSLGCYLTWSPRQGLTDADRNCVSNIRGGGLSYQAAAHRIAFLLIESRRRKLSGVLLKENAGEQIAPAALESLSSALPEQATKKT